MKTKIIFMKDERRSSKDKKGRKWELEERGKRRSVKGRMKEHELRRGENEGKAFRER